MHAFYSLLGHFQGQLIGKGSTKALFIHRAVCGAACGLRFPYGMVPRILKVTVYTESGHRSRRCGVSDECPKCEFFCAAPQSRPDMYRSVHSFFIAMMKSARRNIHFREVLIHLSLSLKLEKWMPKCHLRSDLECIEIAPQSI